MTTVVAAIIRREGLILVCQRRPGQSHELKWEFPGGKVEPGEEPRHALARELDEELGIEAVPGREIIAYEYAYPGRKPIRLIFYEVSAYGGELRNRVFQDVQWAAPESLPRYDFLEGDRDLVQGIARGLLLQ
jgi:8-oxo-dGTP diphosphatase